MHKDEYEAIVGLILKNKEFNIENKEKVMKEYKKLSKEELKEKLNPMEYKVTQENGTEPPFKNEYFNHFEEGIYVDVTSGRPLFTSKDKFDSGCGWPAFSKPIEQEVVKENMDTTFGMKRVEVRSNKEDSHLGHVFEDGPKSLGGLRYCINSAALKFIPKEDMEELGYGEYLSIFQK